MIFNPKDNVIDSKNGMVGEVNKKRLKRLKDLCSYIKGYAFKSDEFIEDGIPVIKATDIKRYGIIEPSSFINPLSFEKYMNVMLKTGDIVISSVGSQPHILDSAVGQLAQIDEKTSGSLLNQNTVILRVIAEDVDSQFLYYNLISKAFRDHLDFISRGTANQASIKINETMNFKVFLPTLTEQQGIANYLDNKIAQIDQKIDLLTKKGKKYSELSQCLINRFVTKGLNKTAKMKNSEVDWIGEVPENWKIRRLKDIASQSKEKNGNKPIGEMLSVSGYRGIEVKQYDDDLKKRTTEELSEYRVVRVGQLVVNTMWLNYRGIGVSKHLGYVSPAYRSYYLDNTTDGSYIHYLMRSDLYVAGYSKYLQGIRPNSLQMKTVDFESLPMILPPIEEQKAIANSLDYKTEQINNIIESINIQIDKLKELRKTLINDVVTGKIKVIQEGVKNERTALSR